MMKLSCDVIAALKGYTLVTAESCTGGGIGAALTDIPGSSAVFKGGVISYTDEVKVAQLCVDSDALEKYGAVSAEVARQMAVGAREGLGADYAVSVTGLAGPDGDAYGNPVGTVFIGFASKYNCVVQEYHFAGDRSKVREQAIGAALELTLNQLKEKGQVK